MKKLILFILSVAGAIAAPPTITAVKVDYIDYATARVTAKLSGIVSDPHFRTDWGFAHNAINVVQWETTCEYKDLDASGSVDTTVCGSTLIGLTPNTKIYIYARARDGADVNTNWGCSGGSPTEGSITGATCTGGENYPWFMTAAAPGPWNISYPSGTYPIQPTAPTLRLPTIVSPVEGTNLFTVASDCSNLQAKIDLAGAAVTDKNVEVVLPKGVTCAAPTLPAKSNAFTMIIRSSATADELPPPGTRITAAHQSVMATIKGANNAVAFDATTNGYTFVGILLTVDDQWPTADVAALTITRSEQNDPGGGPSAYIWQFTTSTTLPASMVAGAFISLEGVPDLEVAEGNCQSGPVHVNTVPSSTTFTLYCNGYPVVPPIPDTTTPNRFLIPTNTQRITGVTPGACSSSNAQITLAASSRLGFAVDDTIFIAGTGTGLANFENHNFRVASLSGNTACLKSSSTVSGTYVANSAVYSGDGAARNIIQANGAATDIWFDRCWITGPLAHEFPNRIYATVGFTQFVNSGVVNSRVTNMGGWSAIDPDTGLWKTYQNGLGVLTGIAFELTYVNGILIDNNYIEGTGILIFPQQNNISISTSWATDITITRNDILMPERRRAGGPESDGLYWPHRHALECKTCEQVLFEGNTVTNNWSDDVSAGVSVAFTNRQMSTTNGENQVDPFLYAGQMRDLTLRHNWFNSAGGINIQTNSDSSTTDTSPLVRVAIHNNVFDMPYWAMRSNPSSAGAAYQNSVTGATQLYTNMFHSLLFDHNTTFNEYSAGPRIFSLSATRPTYHVPFFRFTNNIWTMNKPADPPIDYGGIAFETVSNDLGIIWPELTSFYDTDATDLFDTIYSRYAGNLIIPGSENNFSQSALDVGCYSSTAGDCNITEAERNVYFNTSALANYIPMTGVTLNATTPNGRFDQVKFFDYAQQNYQLKYDSPIKSGAKKADDLTDVGVDLQAMYNAQGKLTSGAYLVNGSATKVRYIAPTTAACYTKPSNDLLTGTWTSDSGGARVRNTTVTLGGATTVWLACGSQLYSCSTSTGPCTLQSN